MDAIEIYARRLNAKDVSTPMKGENSYSLSQMEQSKMAGGDQRLRTPTFAQTKETNEEFFKENQTGFLPTTNNHLFDSKAEDDSTLNDAEATNDFWSNSGDFVFRHHMEPRVQLYVPTEESFPIPLKYIEV